MFATRNPGKLVELRQLLPGAAVLGIDEAAARLGSAIAEVDEDADTFAGNAAKKAREVSRATGLPWKAQLAGSDLTTMVEVACARASSVPARPTRRIVSSKT